MPIVYVYRVVGYRVQTPSPPPVTSLADRSGVVEGLRLAPGTSRRIVRRMVNPTCNDWTKRLRRGMGGAVWVGFAPSEEVDLVRILV